MINRTLIVHDDQLEHVRRNDDALLPKTRRHYEVAVAMPSGERIDEIQQQLSELLIAGRRMRSEANVPNGRFAKSLAALLTVVCCTVGIWRHVPAADDDKSVRRAGTAAPQVLMEGATRDQIVAAVNQNSSRDSIAHRDGRDDHHSRYAGPAAAERQHCRRTAGPIPPDGRHASPGQEIDMGSNDELFWMWVRRNQPPAVYFCRHAQFANSNIRQMMPVEPSWLLAALGMVDIDPASVFDGPLPSRAGRARSNCDRGCPPPPARCRRVTVIDARRAWVIEQDIYDQAGKTLLASARAESHRYYPRRTSFAAGT